MLRPTLDKNLINKISAFILTKESSVLRKQLYQILVIITLSKDQNSEGYTHSKIKRDIEKELDINKIPDTLIIESINELLDKQIIFKRGSLNYYYLTEEYKKRMDIIEKSHNNNLINVKKNLEEQLFIAMPDEEKLNILTYVNIFIEFISEIFRLYGIETCGKILKECVVKIEKDENDILKSYLKLIDNIEKRRIVQNIYIYYLLNPDEYLRDYVFSLAQTYFNIGLLQIDPELNAYTRISLNQKIIYLDTNIIYHSLIKTDKRSESTNEALKLANNLGINLRYTKLTKKEYLTIIKYKKMDINKVVNIKDESYEKISSELGNGIVKDYYEKRKTNPNINIETFFLRMEEFNTILDNLYLIKIDDSDYPDVLQSSSFESMAQCVLAASDEAFMFKTINTVNHDAFHLLLIKKFRQENPSDLLGPNYWFLTNDRSLKIAEKRFDEFEEITSSIEPAQLIQIISPFLVPELEPEAREAFTRLLGSKLVLASDFIDENDYLMLHGEWIDDPGLTAKDVARIIGNKYVREFLRKIKDNKITLTSEQINEYIEPFIENYKENKRQRKDIERLSEENNDLEKKNSALLNFLKLLKYPIGAISFLIIFIFFYLIIFSAMQHSNAALYSILISSIFGYLIGFPGYGHILDKIFEKV